MGTRYLIDTNAAIDFLGRNLSLEANRRFGDIINEELNLSIINKIELLSFPSPDKNLFDFISFANLFYLEDEVVDKTIEIRRNFRIKLPDAIIAATAMVHDLTLLTRNTKDFQKITGLKFQNPQTDL
jgi:predicted nucleic acid-binding protein